MRRLLFLRAALVSVAVLCSALFVLRDARNTPVFYGDALGYYLYLPATLLYDGPVSILDKPPTAIAEPGVRSQLVAAKDVLRTEKGHLIIQYTYGVALLETPAFIAAHLYAKAAGVVADGFSEPYVIALRLLHALYALIGLLLTYRILRRYFGAELSVLTVVMLFLGTNLFWFSLRQAGMSHVPLFFLYALLTWQSILLYERPAVWRFVLIGLITGVIALIRPTDVVCLLVPLLYGVFNWRGLQERLNFLWKHRAAISLAAIAAAAPIVPQLFYWKAVSGHWLYYSYGSQRFDWTHPHILQGLIGANNGWLAYSPLMLLALIGLLRLKGRLADWRLPLLVLLPLYCYIIYAWYCFNYINGFGSRPMLHLYPLLALPLAALFQWVGRQHWTAKGATAALTIFFIACSLSWMHLEANGKLRSEDSNWPYNLSVLFRNRLTYADLVMKDIAIQQPDPRQLSYLRTVAYNGFDDSTGAGYVRDTGRGRSGYVYFSRDEEHPPGSLKAGWNAADFAGASWLRVSGRFRFTGYFGLYENHVLIADVRRRNEYPLWYGLRLESKVGIADSTCPHWNGDYKLDHADQNRWGAVWCFIPLPRDLQAGDTLEVSVWGPARHEVYMDDLRAELWQ